MKNIYLIGNSNIFVGSPLYSSLLTDVGYDVFSYGQADNSVLSCVAILMDWNPPKDSIVVIHAGCCEMVPINKGNNLHWVLNSHNYILEDNPLRSYLYETIERYMTKPGNSPYMTEEEFRDSCRISRKALDGIRAEKKIVIGINYIPEDDWRFKYLEKANKNLKDNFGDLRFIDMFKPDMLRFIEEDRIHLNADGHKYIYNKIMDESV